MPTIRIENIYDKKIVFEKPKQVLALIHENQVDWMHACGGKGRCTTCKMIVNKGMDSLSAPSPFEKKCLEGRILSPDERLACQCVAKGDISIRVPEVNKLPHMDYSD